MFDIFTFTSLIALFYKSTEEKLYVIKYALQSESTLYSCPNVKELLTRNRRDI